MCFLAHAYFSRVHQHLFCAEYRYMCRCSFVHQQLCCSLFWTILKGSGNAVIKSDSITWLSSSHGTPTASSSLFQDPHRSLPLLAERPSFLEPKCAYIFHFGSSSSCGGLIAMAFLDFALALFTLSWLTRFRYAADRRNRG